jgi:hypothetical protein
LIAFSSISLVPEPTSLRFRIKSRNSSSFRVAMFFSLILASLDAPAFSPTTTYEVFPDGAPVTLLFAGISGRSGKEQREHTPSNA